MEGMEFVLAIVAIVFGAGIINNFIKRGQESKGLDLDALMEELGLSDMDDMDKYKKKINDLEERVQVLEKLATSKKHTLADEIERL